MLHSTVFSFLIDVVGFLSKILTFAKLFCINLGDSKSLYAFEVKEKRITSTNLLLLASAAMKAINGAFQEYKQKTCIRFRPRMTADRDYILFFQGRG